MTSSGPPVPPWAHTPLGAQGVPPTALATSGPPPAGASRLAAELIDQWLLDAWRDDPTRPRICIIDDDDGALVAHAVATGAAVTTWNDSRSARDRVAAQCASAYARAFAADEAAPGAATARPLPPGTAPAPPPGTAPAPPPGAPLPVPDPTASLAAAMAGANLVLGAAPKALDRLSYFSRIAAANAAPGAQVVWVQRVKHLHRSMNQVLERHLEDVHATRGAHKARGLVGRVPRLPTPTPAYDPASSLRVSEPELGLDLDVVALPGVFAGTRVDIGTRALLAALPAVLDQGPPPRTAVDLGCGTGILAAWIASRCPGATVIATDDSALAVASAGRTALAAGIACRPHDAPNASGQQACATAPEPGIATWWADAAAGIRAASVDLIVCNPPFHQGAGIDTSGAHAMFASAGRILAPGGRLVVVANRHLRYASALRARVGPTTLVASSPKFVVTLSSRSAR
ncbi:class I SAM-dependent methyltransferase [Rarobacter incanus]|uniref:16S rRNA G1207 methylase RsmC n=1 Tax=Rarobacter incanus TaxID=153494 RepID=A0A542SQ50_9MICO|nr:methyltransferase [Rarobacter incanus]TQK76736.1 16S rRNA G1207 methylase RsmC [Rarobacter incanus]